MIYLGIYGDSVAEFFNDGVTWIDLQHTFALHVCLAGRVGEGLGLHDPLHVGAPSIFAGHHDAGAGR